MNSSKKKLPQSCLAALMLGLFSAVTLATTTGDLQDIPLSVGKEVAPMTMLVMSNDHQLYYKAYSDYSDLDGDGVLDTTYKDTITYNGYFDSGQCYSYATGAGRFEPTGLTNGGRSDTSHTCSGAWSGNFLNWASMTRMDVIRQVLYGGKRHVDGDTLDGSGNTTTVLARAALPRDVHSFVKVFESASMNLYTPFSEPIISICNLSPAMDPGETTTLKPGAPQMRVAKGSESGQTGWPFWSSGERSQCTWRDESSVGLDKGPDQDTRPRSATGQQMLGEYFVYVEVCSGANASTDSRCREYSDGTNTNYKPAGILQEYGETGEIQFGLITGTYANNISGGVLRSQMKTIIGNLIDNDGDPDTPSIADTSKNEIDTTNGTFNHSAVTNGIIETIDAFTITRFNYSNTTYGDCSSPGIPAISETNSSRRCSNWGNPIAEMYLEALRYISGAQSSTQLAPTTVYNDGSTDGDDEPSGRFSVLDKISSWSDPYTLSPANACANCNIVLISTGLNSFDTDELSGASDINGISGIGTINGYLDNTIMSNESISGDYFVGETDSVSDNRCTAKTVSTLSTVKGSCPEVPSQEGGYHIAGLAYHAKMNDLRSDLADEQTVDTYAISLAESVPSFEVAVGSNTVSFVPTCESKGGSNGSRKSLGNTDNDWNTCSLIDVIVKDSSATTGSFTLTWEDSPWGNDYDMDAIVDLDYCVGASCSPAVNADQIVVTMREVSAAAGFSIRFGYTITGVDNSGVTFGVIWKDEGANNGFSYLVDNDGDIFTKPSSTTTSNSASAWVQGYSVNNSPAARLLENPLWYAAKYGGFNDLDNNGLPNNSSNINGNPEWDAVDLDGEPNPDGIPDSYFPVRNPAQLENSFATILGDITSGGSATGASFSSSRITEDTLLFQSTFNTESWTGDLEAFLIASDGSIDQSNPVWSAADKLVSQSPSSRNILTYNSEASTKQGVVFASPANVASLQASEISQSMVDDLLTEVPTGVDNGTYLDGIINYIKGDTSAEVRNITVSSLFSFRNRLDENDQPFTLGALVHSTPEYMGDPSEPYPDLISGDETKPYSSFNPGRSSPVVFVGANDGMMHAFDASPTSAGGVEVFAYIPSFLSNSLYNLADKDYEYQAYVDGPITVRDVFINGNWRSYLVGATRTGGKGIYVLDVTNPSTMNTSNVIGEFTHSDLGATFSTPQIVKMNNNKWAAVFGNGYNNSGDGEAKLFILYLDADFSNGLTEGTEYRILETKTGPLSAGSCSLTKDCNGLSSPTVADLDGDFVVDRIYAGDLYGNMWAFDVSSTSEGSWGSAYGGSSPTPLFSACRSPCSASDRQPITSAPQIQLHPARRSSQTAPNVLVYFGTGQYMAVDDDQDQSVQTFYSIWDTGVSTNSNLTFNDLNQQSFTASGTGEIDVVSTPVKYTATRGDAEGGFGWYINMDGSSTSGFFNGGRVVINPILIGEIIFFAVTVPEVEEFSCTPGGDSYLVALNAFDGSAPDFLVFDLDNDGEPDNSGPTFKFDGSVVGLGVILDGKGKVKLGVSKEDGSNDTLGLNPNKFIPEGRKAWSIIK
ncbi:MAG: pilus assembly protein [Cellvibrionaceae bacterium]